MVPLNHGVIVIQPPGAIDAMIDYLRSPEANRWVRAHAPGVDNGYLSITPTLIKRLPVPQHLKQAPQGRQPAAGDDA